MWRSSSSRAWLIAGALICLLGFAIRLHNLGGDSFWLDEILTVRVAREGVVEALAPQRDHPPLHFLLAAISIQALGENEFTARLPSLMAGALGIPLLILLGRTLRFPGVGLWAGLLLAFSPLHLKYTQEARNYALLMAVSLLSYILLFRALQRPSLARWLLYGAATALSLYTHYGALVVLVTQFVLLLPWIWRQWRARDRARLQQLIIGGLVSFLLYLPWLPQMYWALTTNVGSETIVDTGTAATAGEWMQVVITSFGMYEARLSWVFLGLSLLGALIWLARRPWREPALALLSLLLPLVLVLVFPLNRGAFARYVIYLLPFYLLFIAVVPAATTESLAKAGGRVPFVASSLLGAAAIALLAWGPVQREYNFIQEDWRSILAHLEEEVQSGAVIVPLSLSFVNGYNLILDSLPYYLARAEQHYQLLPGEGLLPGEIKALPEQAQVHALVLNWGTPTVLAEPGYTVTPFMSWLFFVTPKRQTGTAAERLIALYEQLLPLAYAPVPRCLLHQDQAALHAATGTYQLAESYLLQAEELCPENPPRAPGGAARRADIWSGVYDAMADDLARMMREGEGDSRQAHDLAERLLAIDAKNEVALQRLTAVDLLERYDAGDAISNANGAPEAIAVKRFTMPESGDWEDVIFTHPPATVSFSLKLPSAPVAFRSRLALDPESRDWGGDGATFILRLEDANGESHELYRQHVGNDRVGYGWHDVQVSLAAFVAQPVTLTLGAEPGPSGRSDADWAGWAAPRLVWLIED